MKPILNAWRTQRVDQVAKLSMPQDVPKGLVPISTIGDGNCFAWAISTALFGNQNHHKEIRMWLVFEAVLNKDKYLDNEYLKNGVAHIHGRGTFPQAVCFVHRSEYSSLRLFRWDSRSDIWSRCPRFT